MKLYFLHFNDSLGTREQITAHLDTNTREIIDWYYCMTNTIFIVSNYTAKQLAEFLKPLDKKNVGRFVVIELNRDSEYWGWLPDDAWEFIKKYL